MKWEKTVYQRIFIDRNKINWEGLAARGKKYRNYAQMPNPIMMGTDQHRFWNRFFSRRFNVTRITYGWFLRVINSAMIDATP